MNKILKSKFYRLCVPIIALLLFITSASAAGTEETITVTWAGVDYFNITYNGYLGTGRSDFNINGTIYNWSYRDVEEDSHCVIEPTDFDGYLDITLVSYEILGNNCYEMSEDWYHTALYADGQALRGYGSFPYIDEYKDYFARPGHPASFTFGENFIIMPDYLWEDTFTLSPDTMCLILIQVYDGDGNFIVRCIEPIFIRSVDRTCGANLTWEIDENGVLLIEGTGDMYDYDSVNRAPWLVAENPPLSRVKIGDGVTSIGSCAFHGLNNLTEIKLPDSIESIGECAFYGCENLESVTIGYGVKAIYSSAFDECPNLSQITYRGSLMRWNTINIEEENENLNSERIRFLNYSPADEIEFLPYISRSQAAEALGCVASGESITIIIPAEIAEKATTMLVPVYDENGRMIDFKMVAVTSDGDTFTSTFTFSKAQDAASLNILLLDANWNPVAENLSIKP